MSTRKEKKMFMYHPNEKDIGIGNRYSEGWLGSKASTAHEIADIVKKYAYSPCLWAYGQRKKTNFRAAVWLGLDFDEGLSLDKALEIFRDYYHVIGITKSHQIQKGNEPPCDRFRVLLKFNQTVKKVGDYEATVKQMIKKYGADPACSDGARMLWPCQEIVAIKSYGKVIEPVDSAKEEEQRKKYYDRKFAKSKRSLKVLGVKKIPRSTKLKLSWCGDGCRNNTCFRVASDLKDVGYSQAEAFEIIWNSAIPLDKSDRVYAEVQKTVRSAYK